MDWQASIEERGALITFRALTGIYKGGALVGDRADCIEPGQSWSGRSFEDWLAFLKERGGSVTVGFDGFGRVCRAKLGI